MSRSDADALLSHAERRIKVAEAAWDECPCETHRLAVVAAWDGLDDAKAIAGEWGIKVGPQTARCESRKEAT